MLAAAVDQAGNRENPPAARSFIIDPAQEPAVAPEATTETPAGTPAVCEATITVDAQFGVNVRQGPGVQYEIVTTLPQGETALISGQNSSGSWWRLALDVGTSSQYWVSDDV
ncbi:MAG: SH3 domain-containing protein [Chloroflexi bacterium]|nr:SH3 domain-containing protein [Chloroflexota bacterium]